MKATEIQVADWVMAHGIDHPVKVAGIDAEYKGDVWVKIQDGATVYSESLVNIEPIPLTEEFLRKIGFKIDRYESDCVADGVFIKQPIWLYEETGMSMQYDGWEMLLVHDAGRICDNIAIHNDLITCKLSVHELQHALRHCGIEKEIKL